MIKVVLVDDEELARIELRRLLAHHPELEVIGEADGFTSARQLLQRVHPDLIFLDIKMPGYSGFDLLSSLPPPHPRIVFVTAYDAFALRAFDVNALDYLLKPVHPERLAATLSRLRSLPTLNSGSIDLDLEETVESGSGEGGMPFREDDQIFLREGDRCWFVPIRDLKYLETEGNYTRVHFGGGSPLICRRLAALEARLPSPMFCRANRAQLVNVRFIERIEPWFSGSLKAYLRGGPEIEFSRRQAQIFRNRSSP